MVMNVVIYGSSGLHELLVRNKSYYAHKRIWSSVSCNPNAYLTTEEDHTTEDHAMEAPVTSPA